MTGASCQATLEIRDGERTAKCLGAHGGERVLLSRTGERVVNGFHVHAVGWVLTANAFTLTPAEAHELTDLWTNLVRLRNEDLRQAHPLLQFLLPRRLPLSPSTQAALAMLVARMAAQHPERFSSAALRQRRNHWACQAGLGFLLTVLLAVVVPKSWPLVATAPPTFFLMGCACLLPAVTLWRAAGAVHGCSVPGRVRWHLPHKLSSHLRLR